MTDAIPPERHPVQPPPPPARRSNRRAVVALVCGGLAFLLAGNNAVTPLPIDASLSYALSFYFAPLPLIGIAIAAGYSGSIRARSTGRGQVPAVIGLSLGLVALGFVALSMITVIEVFA
ncbi:hypothetical protein [Nocardia jiangsuensis]|uniref:DUF4190 domain-containing protein n=1 Tax=Nocardia jiangsuensis TaxID=1691563 RepID=A0ABV8DMR7_9NOCA